MAFKSLEQIQALIREATSQAMLLEGFMDNALLVRAQAMLDAIKAGDDAPENAQMINALNALLSRAGDLREAASALIRTTYRPLGRFAGAPDPMQEDELKHLDYWVEYLRAQNKQVRLRGFSKPTSGSAVFNGAGAGKIAIATTDLNGQLIDVGHIDTIKLECKLDESRGAQPGQEQFEITGGPRTWPWQEGGIGTNGGDYKHPYGRVPGDLIPKIASAGKRIVAVPATNGIVNILANGDLEQALNGTGDDKIPEWTISSGTPADWTLESTDPLNGVANIKTVSNGVLRQLIPDGRIKAGGVYGISLKAMVHSTGTPGVTGTVTVKIMDRDGGTTHGTLTLDLSTLVNDEKTVIQPIIFKAPNDIEQLKCEVELASLGGTGTGKTVHFDDICVAEARMIDGVLVYISDGTHVVSGSIQGRFARGDTFTFTTTSTDAGKIQKHYANRAAGRYLPADTNADAGFEDPEDSPVMEVYQGAAVDPDEEIADDGGDDAGAGLATPFTRTYTIRNTGLYPLIIDNIAFSAETNVAGAVDTPARQCIRPGETSTLVLEFTPGGTGAIASTVTIEFNDPEAGLPDGQDFVFEVTGTAT